MVLDFVAAFIVLFCVLMLTVYHCYLMARNQTTIESWERSKVKRLVITGKIPLVCFDKCMSYFRFLSHCPLRSTIRMTLACTPTSALSLANHPYYGCGREGLLRNTQELPFLCDVI